MEFQGPLPADYDNVHSLNFAWLDLLQNNGGRYLAGLSQDLISRLRRLDRTEIERLAATPFLLFSLRERDDVFWRELLGESGSRDLFSVSLRVDDDAGRLVCAGLGFVWQLANRNPFAARLLCGASTHWCEQITEYTIFNLLAAAGHRSDLLCLRAQHDTKLWRKLLAGGISKEKNTRAATRISALQYVLTRQSGCASWQAAACASPDPGLKVAEEPKS